MDGTTKHKFPNKVQPKHCKETKLLGMHGIQKIAIKLSKFSNYCYKIVRFDSHINFFPNNIAQRRRKGQLMVNR